MLNTLPEINWQKEAEKLDQARKDAEVVQAQYAREFAQWELAHLDLIQDKVTLQKRAEELELGLRALILARFQTTGDKLGEFGLSVRLTDHVDFEDLDAIRAWCLAHDLSLLKVDTTAVAERVRAGVPIPGVRVLRRPTSVVSNALAKSIETTKLKLAKVLPPIG